MKNSNITTAPFVLGNLASTISVALTSLRRIVSMLLSITCITTLIIVSSPVVLQAQTEWKDNYVTLAAQDQTNPTIARPSQTEYTVIVWEDARDGGTDIYAQKIDNVNGLPQWSPVDGVPVCTASYDQTDPRAAYDSLGNVIIVWEDGRGESSTTSVFAQSLDVSDGSANWQTNGIAVCDTSADAKQPRIVGVAEGAYIAWVDSRNVLDVADSTNRDIYLQYLYSQTASWPTGSGVTWQSCGILVSGDTTGLHDERNVELARDNYWQGAVDTKDKDGVVLVYESQRAVSGSGGADSIYVIYADSYDADGNWRWKSQDVRCAANNEEQLNPRVVVLGNLHGSGDSVAVIIWQDARENPTDKLYDIYGQLIAKDSGFVVGASSGNPICTAEGTQRYPELSLYEIEEQGGQSYGARVICVWEDLRNSGSTGIDIYCAVMDAVTMTIATGTGTDGEEVCCNANDQRYPMVDNFPGNQDAYIVWQHDYNDYFSDVWYQSIDLGDLQFSWTQPVGLAVTEAKDSQVKPQVGGDVFVYADRRRNPISYDNRNDWNIYSETPGECVGDEYMAWRDMFAEVTTTGDATHMRFVVDAEFNSLVVWEEPGERVGEQNVFIQKLDVDGVPRWENSGIRLNTNRYSSHPEVTISDSTGGAQVVWHERNGQTDSIWYAKLSPMGACTTKQHIAAGKGPVIAYTDYVTGGGTSIYPAFIAGIVPSSAEVWYWDGTKWNPANLTLASTPEEVLIRASMGGGWFLAAYSARGGSAFLDAAVRGNSGAPVVIRQTGDSLRGVGIERDDNATTAMKHGCIVYSMAPSGTTLMNLYSIHLDPVTPHAAHLPYSLITAGANQGARYPALCPDTCAITANQRAGLLLAWDWEYQQGGVQRHKVQTNQLTFAYPYWIFTGSSHITVSDTTTHIMYPDIARVRSSAVLGDTAAFVVWESALEVCGTTRPVEVACNWVVYDSLSTRRGKQWSWAKQASPGSGTYTQLKPMVQTSKDNSVNVFWYDGRGAADLVMGTRLWGDSSGVIYWAKEKLERPEIPPATIQLGEHYPTPLSLSRSSVSTIAVEVTAETEVSLKIYDNLGRERATVYEGVLTAGSHYLQFNASGLRPGTYYYVLRGTDTMTTRGFIVLR